MSKKVRYRKYTQLCLKNGVEPKTFNDFVKVDLKLLHQALLV